MKWDKPPIIKIYEALGSLGDGRLEVTGNEGKLYSSSRNKFYVVKWDPETKSIMANDNASFFVGYLGYPAIAFLMDKGIIEYDKKWAKALKGIAWKDINQKYKNSFEKTKAYADEVIAKQGLDISEFEEEIEKIAKQIKDLKLNYLGKKIKPPKGY